MDNSGIFLTECLSLGIKEFVLSWFSKSWEWEYPNGEKKARNMEIFFKKVKGLLSKISSHFNKHRLQFLNWEGSLLST